MWDENKVRIVDVADALGLSTATVSNVSQGAQTGSSIQPQRFAEELGDEKEET